MEKCRIVPKENPFLPPKAPLLKFIHFPVLNLPCFDHTYSRFFTL